MGELLHPTKLFQFGIAADERRQPATDYSLEPGARRTSTRQFVNFHWLGKPFNRQRAQRLGHDKAFGKPERGRREQDAARARELLHACRQVRGSPHGRVVHTEIAADGAYNNLTGIQSDADLQVHAMSIEYSLGVALHPLLHAQRREAGTHGVILMSEGSTEQCHNPVSRGLVDGSLVVVDSLHHVVEDRVEKLARLLGITVGQ
jgi:hypothetical protein